MLGSWFGSRLEYDLVQYGHERAATISTEHEHARDTTVALCVPTVREASVISCRRLLESRWSMPKCQGPGKNW
jgi:hypothetical protein